MFLKFLKCFKFRTKIEILNNLNRKMSTNKYYDPCSFANPNAFLITHVSFNWNIDFERKVIKGSCDLTFKKNSDNAGESIVRLIFFLMLLKNFKNPS